MEKSHHNKIGGFFKRNHDKKSPKNNNKRNSKSQLRNHAPNQMISDKIGAREKSSDMTNQRELSEVNKVYLQHLRQIEKEIVNLISDVQYLDSKNPVVSSDMRKILVELIINVWKIGNIVTALKEENELAVVSQLLSKYEKRYLRFINDSTYGSDAADEIKSIKMCQNIITDSLHQINSTVEYYNILMLKLSDWGFEVKNPVGQKYNVHMDIDILAFEDPDPNLEVPIITETKKPEIYLNGNKLARAQVVVRKAGRKNSKGKKKVSKKNGW